MRNLLDIASAAQNLDGNRLTGSLLIPEPNIELPSRETQQVTGCPESPQNCTAEPDWVPSDVLAARGRVRQIQCLKLLRCQSQCEGDRVFLYMCWGTGFGNRNDVTAPDRPGQRNGCCRATARCANTCKRGITQQAGARTAER